MVAALGRKIAGKLLKPKPKVIPMSEVSKRMADRKPTVNKGTKPNADAAGKAFVKNKPPAGSGDQGKQRVLPRGDKGTGKLQQQFEALTKSAQRAEVAKGANSKYASVLRKLGKLKDGKKAGGKVMYREAGGPLKDVPAGNKGLPQLSTTVRNKMGFAKGGGKVMKYKKGGIVYMKNGGAVGSKEGAKLVAACYD